MRRSGLQGGLLLVVVLGLAGVGCADGSAHQQHPGDGEEGEGEGACTNPCQLGQEQCQGSGASRQCVEDAEGCTAWSEPTPCPAQSACSDDHCQTGCHAECEVGSVTCYGAAVRTCEPPVGAGCASWGPPVDCEAGQSCTAGQCQAGCEDECAEGVRTCEAGGVRPCGEFDDDPCLDWGPQQPCPEGESCSLGQCAVRCDDECAGDSRTCDGGGYKSCGQYDADDCLEWSHVVLCLEGEGCSDGVCSAVCANECETGTHRCSADGLGTVECGEFDDDPCRDWGPAQPCAGAQSCSFGECAESCTDECVLDSKRCAAGGVEECGHWDADECLEWSQAVPCPDGETCSGGACALGCSHECSGGAVTCGDGGVRRCGRDFDADPCDEWGPDVPCPQGQVCSNGACAAACSNECAAGSKQCALGGYQVCGNSDPDDCLEWSAVVACAAGQSCSGGTCAATCRDECAANAVQCSAGGVQRCGEANDGDACLDWRSPLACPAGKICSLGACVAACSDECEADSTRCAGDGLSSCGDFDGNGCLEWGVAAACPGGQVCSGTRCVAACQDECVVGRFQCSGNGLQSCAAGTGANSCTRWGAVLGGSFVAGASLPCGEGLTCSSGQCRAVCTDECGVDELRCSGNAVQRCGEYDSDSCRDWSPGATACAANQSCSSGQCLASCQHECEAGQTRCVEDGGAAAEQACGEAGDGDACREWRLAMPCAGDQVCSPDHCHGCEPQPEVADGVDNDCDQLIDEAPAGTLPNWCRLQAPTTLDVTEGLASGLAYGQLLAQGMTEPGGAHPAVLAQLGWGPVGSSPDGLAPAGWSWQDATYNAQCGACGNNDEYFARLLILESGSYDYAFRFSVDGGASWLACDSDGSGEVDGAYEPAKAGHLTVGPGLSWGNLQWPREQQEILAGQSPGDYYGQVYQPGLTEAAGAPAGLRAQVGFGPDGVDPRDDPAAWSWVDASWHGQAGDQFHNDEFVGQFTVPTAGTFDVAYRYSLNDGVSWVYADLNGIDYHPADSASLVVR